MRWRLVLRPQAEADVDGAAECYAREQGVDLGLRFYAAADQSFATLLERPYVGRVLEWRATRLRGYRSWHVVSPFNIYRIFYRPSSTAIEVLRVLHGARDIEAALLEALLDDDED